MQSDRAVPPHTADTDALERPSELEKGIQTQRIAVVGAGISGLAAAWLLQRAGASVTLLEKETQCGGHSLTDDSAGFPVDLGFQVFNLSTYPHLTRLLETLGVDTEESEMSFALSVDGGLLEWASHGLSTVFAQRTNLLRASFWRMLWDVVRFGRQAPKVLDTGCAKYEGMSLGDFLASEGYSSAFRDDYLLPMCAAVWSATNNQVLRFPIQMLIRFWSNHYLLDIFQRPVWRVVKGRSRSYVQAMLADIRDVRMNTEVTSISPSTPLSGPRVHTTDGGDHDFDAVVLATHSDISLKLLGTAAPAEVRAVLDAIPYGDSEVWVHTDARLMPRRQDTWASWNLISRSGSGDDAAACVTYWLNRLQQLPPGAPDVFVTLNPVVQPAASQVLRHVKMSHPVFSQAGCEAQNRLPGLQGIGGVHLAGAWCGYGFHEDGLKAGISVAERLGARVPWLPRPTNPKIGLMDRIFIAVFDGFAKRALRRGSLRLILPNGQELTYGAASSCSNGKAADGDASKEKDGRSATVRIYDCAFFRKVIFRHDTGLGESYMDNDFEVSGDFASLLDVLTANAVSIQDNRGALSVLNWVGDKLLFLAHLARSNTAAGSRQNIREHYDAGNDMFRLFLDSTMTYSGAIHAPGDTLEEAQLRKLDSLIQLAKLKAGDSVLEIGCGWGSLAIRAVQAVGCTWTGITLSEEQLKEARQRVAAAGLEDHIRLMFCDYRHLPPGPGFDKVLSCEMVEAVGQEHLQTYFDVIGSVLKPGGIAVLQAISEPDDRYEAYCASSDFIREHIFPGGHLPCLAVMREAGQQAGLDMTAAEDIGKDYAVTLKAWRAAWEAKKEEAIALGYSERFWRKYRFYFAYCEAAFDARYIHNWQVAWVNTSTNRKALPTVEAAGSPDGQPMSRDPADPCTQVLLAVYAFLAGIAVSQSQRLWVMPLATAFYWILLGVADVAIRHACKLHPAMKSRLGGEGMAWLGVNAVHLFHSSLTAPAAAVHVVSQFCAWQQSPAVGDAAARQLLPDLLIFTSAGFFAFQLFALVRRRLFRRVHKVVLHFTVLLALFGSAGFKAERTPLLACTLLSEFSTLFYLGAKIQDLCGWSAAGRLSRLILVFGEIPATLFLRALPHALIGLWAACSPSAFSNKAFYLVAVVGAVYINLVNLRRFALLMHAAQPAKLHAA